MRWRLKVPDSLRYLGQAFLYSLFFLPLVYFTSAPAHRHQADAMATLKVAVRHAGKVVGECTALSGAEVDNLPANMKRMEICPRERSALQLELIVDGEQLYRSSVPASGIHNDGMSSMYKRFTLPAGRHHLQLRMNDDQSVEGATWQLDETIDMAPAQVVVASFHQGFRLQ
jgi:hypothetical protein